MLQVFETTDPNYDWVAHYQRIQKRIAGTPAAPQTVTIPARPRAPMSVDMGHNHAAHVTHWRALQRQKIADTDMEIVEEVAYRYGVTSDDILGRNRHKLVSCARQELCALLQDIKHWSLPKIGRLLGRTHTTAQFLARAHRERMASDAPSVVVYATGRNKRTRDMRRYEIAIHEIAEAVRMHRAGATNKQISAELKLRPSAVLYSIRCYRGWERKSRRKAGRASHD